MEDGVVIDGLSFILFLFRWYVYDVVVLDSNFDHRSHSDADNPSHNRVIAEDGVESIVGESLADV